jgi:REP element-mobilizing transposase RayT
MRCVFINASRRDARRIQMSSTHLSLNYHIVFSTKNREPWIGASWREELHRYVGGCVRELDGVPLSVGGIADHAHLLVGLRATHSLARVVQDVKRASSQWVHKARHRAGFAWQEGYGAFTVSPCRIDGVRTYISTQAEHHRTKTFTEEYLELLRESKIEFDERYLW